MKLRRSVAAGRARTFCFYVCFLMILFDGSFHFNFTLSNSPQLPWLPRRRGAGCQWQPLPQAATKDAVPSARSARWGRWQPEGLTEGADRLGADGENRMVASASRRPGTAGNRRRIYGDYGNMHPVAVAPRATDAYPFRLQQSTEKTNICSFFLLTFLPDSAIMETGKRSSRPLPHAERGAFFLFRNSMLSGKETYFGTIQSTAAPDAALLL